MATITDVASNVEGNQAKLCYIYILSMIMKINRLI